MFQTDLQWSLECFNMTCKGVNSVSILPASESRVFVSNWPARESSVLQSDLHAGQVCFKLTSKGVSVLQSDLHAGQECFNLTCKGVKSVSIWPARMSRVFQSDLKREREREIMVFEIDLQGWQGCLKLTCKGGKGVLNWPAREAKVFQTVVWSAWAAHAWLLAR